MSPKISIIVPVFNAESYLARSLDSVITQEYHDWECLLVDDGSTDSSGQICNDYADKDSRFRVFHKANGGVSSARNYALSKALGEWITFLDADDALDKDYLSPISDDVQEDLVIGSYKRSDNDRIDSLQDGIYADRELPVFFAKNLACLHLRTPWAKFFRKALIGDLRFDESLRLGEDTLFCQCYYVKCESVKVDSSREYLYTTSDAIAKYNLDVDSVLHVFCSLASVYSGMGLVCTSYNSFLYYFFKAFLEGSKDKLKKWYSCRQVRDFYMRYLANTFRKKCSYYKQWLKLYC